MEKLKSEILRKMYPLSMPRRINNFVQAWVQLWQPYFFWMK